MPDTPGIAGVTRETDCVALIDKGTCNPESHRTEANKETVLNRHAALTTAIPPGLREEGAGKNVHLPVFHWKWFHYVFHKLLLEGSAFN